MTRLAVLVVATACTPQAFTPPARPMPLGGAQTPSAGGSDLQLDGNASGAPLGPDFVGGNVRYRRGVSDRAALTGDLGFARVGGEDARYHAGDFARIAGMARVGVQISAPANDDLDAAAFAGIGGGYAPEAGGWASGDVGAMLTGTNRYVRPVFLVDCYGSQPFATRVFEVDDTMLRLPATVGAQGLVGFELGLRDQSLLVGLAVAFLHAVATDVHDADSEMFAGLGAGFRLAN